MSDPSVPPGGQAGAGATADPEATTVLAEDQFRPDVAALEAALGAANAKAAQHYDQYVRALAEFDNYRRRAARDLDSAQRYALERFAQELLPALDGFELALANAQAADVKSLIAGQAATYRLLRKAFEQAGIAELDPTGQPFNPEQHEAMVAQPSA
ncbi:MAG TPA: nucleotide exchange factor GrpE, partial [Steroidobacteraceae bacterium]|nr:nucleotide exchange factor GrpE [Steroidobacteraceae bacterium]